jgi:diguanylate cyclase (GGDEF)-like protein
VLQQIAARLRSNLRADDIVARVGGEEFGLILHDLKMVDADAFCDRLRESIAVQSVVFGGQTIRVTVSIGLADANAYDLPADVLVAADAALYRAKSDGRNCLRLAA